MRTHYSRLTKTEEAPEPEDVRPRRREPAERNPAPDATPRAQKGPDLRGRDLRKKRLVDLDLQGADLEGADLRGADLRGADLFGARLRRADLRGARLDMNHLLEIWVPPNLPLPIVNQIRHFDFRYVTRRELAANVEGRILECPYRTAALRPVLYEWGSRTWRGGVKWTAPEVAWTLEEIVGAVLTTLGCRHDFAVPPGTRTES